ncbi:class I adenylate-forming enzyme family protein [Virgibacillus halophilus]|uniref:Class I adenylate-forming enzyme family protein n=1 Tax=Tigheibacillus halophilus TaxID=361280 RepID=A0ABU5C397_9BACI|nr:class I adenylate-forming enzyme family protein [Virgibacillus halophilus]
MEAIVLFWATQKLGAVFSPINIMQTKEIIHYCINDLDAKMIVFEKTTEYLIERGKIDYRPLFITIDGKSDITYSELLQGNEYDFNHITVHENDLSIILYTSGTTGIPKGVPRTHLNEYSSTLAYVFHCRYEWMDTSLGVIPLHHTMGIRSLLSMFLLNGTTILLKNFDPNEACQLIQDQKVTCVYLFPSMYHEIVSLTDIKKYDFERLRVISYAGAPMTNRLIQKCQEVLNPAHFINQYGSTEIFTHTICQEIIHKPGCAGKPGIHQKIKVIEADASRSKSEEDVVPNGVIGEVIVSMDSPEAFRGYWNKPEVTKKKCKKWLVLHWGFRL